MRVDVGVNDESHGGFSGCGDRGSDSGEDKRTGFRVRDRVVHSRVCDAHVFCCEQVQTYSFVHRQADCVRVGEYFIYRRDPENDRYSVYMPIFIRYLQRCRLQSLRYLRHNHAITTELVDNNACRMQGHFHRLSPYTMDYFDPQR